MSKKKIIVRTPSDIREIIEEELKNNQQLGFIKDDLLFMNVDANPILFAPLPFFYCVQVFLLIPLFLMDNKTLIESQYLYYAFVPGFLILFLLLVNSLCSHYLIYDFKNECFYTISCLLEIIQLKILKSYNISSKNIKKIILQVTDSLGTKKIIASDRIFLILNHDIKMVLAEYMPCTKYHEISMQRCLLFSKCFNVDFQAIGLEVLERDKKRREKIKKSISYLLLLLAIIASVIIYEIITY